MFWWRFSGNFSLGLHNTRQLGFTPFRRSAEEEKMGPNAAAIPEIPSALPSIPWDWWPKVRNFSPTNTPSRKKHGSAVRVFRGYVFLLNKVWEEKYIPKKTGKV